MYGGIGFRLLTPIGAGALCRHIRRHRARMRRQTECVGAYAQPIPNASADLRISGFIKFDIDKTVYILVT